ncbi:MAG: nitrate reductase [Bacteroidetes bacterium 4572_77]|nr:MAG: nitrate reductase [Bacteroidetes bacterium 4572_77]
MNVSGILVQTKAENTDRVVESIKNADYADYHMHDEKGKIVVTIEGKDVSEEIAKLHQLEKIEHVISADMMYAYSEDELDKEREMLSKGTKMPDWLNDPDAKPEDIVYNGDLRKRQL